jgi:hypothetical protein
MIVEEISKELTHFTTAQHKVLISTRRTGKLAILQFPSNIVITRSVKKKIYKSLTEKFELFHIIFSFTDGIQSAQAS